MKLSMVHCLKIGIICHSEFGSERWVVWDLGEDLSMGMSSKSVTYVIKVTQNSYLCFYREMRTHQMRLPVGHEGGQGEGNVGVDRSMAEATIPD